MSIGAVYYVAVKADDAHLIVLPNAVTVALEFKAAGTTTFSDPELVVPKSLPIAMQSCGIVVCTSPGDIAIAIDEYIKMAPTLTDILSIVTRIGASAAVSVAGHMVAQHVLRYDFGAQAPMNDIDAITLAFKSRKWPVKQNSPDSWKQLCAAGIGGPTGAQTGNWMINAAKRIMGLCEVKSGGLGDNYPTEGRPRTAGHSALTPVPNEFCAKAGEPAGAYIERLRSRTDIRQRGNELLQWLDSMSDRVTDRVKDELFGYMARVVWRDATYVAGSSMPQQIVPSAPKFAPDVARLKAVMPILRGLMAIDDEDHFMYFFCSLLCRRDYVWLLRNVDLVTHMVDIMTLRPVFEPLVRLAISYAVFFMTRIEYDAERSGVSIADANILSMDMIAAMPVFDDVTPYIPIGIKHLKFNVPLRLDGLRTPVPPTDIGARLNAMFVCRERTRFDVMTDIPWLRMQLILTGSRYAGACFIGPLERVDGLNRADSLKQHIVKNLGTSQPVIDALVAAYQELKIDTPCIEPDTSAAIHELVDTLKGKNVSLERRPTDIDIATYCPEAEFDERAAAFVRHLRQFGTVFAVHGDPKFSGRRSWTIVASFLRYAIDFFWPNASPTAMIMRYMTCYSRAFFDGVSHIGTADFMCSQMSGVNYRYINTMYDPVALMLKCARREGITILINYKEQQLMQQWMAINMPGIPMTAGNVSLQHPFYTSEARPRQLAAPLVPNLLASAQAAGMGADATEQKNSALLPDAAYRMPWVSKPITLPAGGANAVEASIWSYEKGGVVPIDQTFITRYIEAVKATAM